MKNASRSNRSRNSFGVVNATSKNYGRRYPPQRQFPALAVAISEFGKHVGVSIPGMTYSTQPSKSGLAVEGSLQFRAIGEYADIYRFIHRLETAQSYLVIESLDVTKSGIHNTSGKSLVELNVRVVTFLRPDPSTQRES